MQLAAALREKKDHLTVKRRVYKTTTSEEFDAADSDGRFELVEAAANGKSKLPSLKSMVTASDGREIARITFRNGVHTIRIDRGNLAAAIIQQLPTIFSTCEATTPSRKASGATNHEQVAAPI